MTTRKRRFRSVTTLVVVAALGLNACGNSRGTPADSSDTTVHSSRGGEIARASGTIKGAGASFPDAFYQEAISGLADLAPDLHVTYNAVGSSSGREAFARGLVDFAGTDSLVGKDDGIATGSFLYVPTTAAPIAVAYDLPGVEGLKLDGPTIARIFQRTITRWDDEAIRALNAGIELPSTGITVVRRADGSGTTKNFTKYLGAAAPKEWKLGAGDTVEWPSDTQGGQQNSGVAQVIADTEGAIGYVDFGTAHELGLAMASIRNAAGAFVAPSIEGTRAALDGSKLGDDLTYDPLDGPGKASYPITAPTYILVRNSYDDARTGAAVVAFVKWLITDGADSYAAKLGYAPLPERFRAKALSALGAVDVG